MDKSTTSVSSIIVDLERSVNKKKRASVGTPFEYGYHANWCSDSNWIIMDAKQNPIDVKPQIACEEDYLRLAASLWIRVH